MKKIIKIRPLEIIVLFIILIGVIFKLKHFAGANELLLLGSLLTIIYYIVNIRKAKTNKEESLKSLIGISIGMFLCVFTWRILYWDNMIIILVLALVVSAFALAFTFIQKTFYIIQLMILAFVFSTSMYFYFMPSHAVYHFVNFQEVNYPEDAPSGAWDRYSRLLYIDDKFEKALEANTNAKISEELHLKMSFSDKDSSALRQIEINRKMIESRTWNQYIWLH